MNKNKYSDQEMMDALKDHTEEIKNILADIEQEQAQRAGIDLLFGDEYDGDLALICKDEISMQFPRFCSEHLKPTAKQVKEYIRLKL